MMSIDLDRRRFLLNSGLAVATATAIATGLAGIDIDTAWALTPTSIDSDTARSLLVMARTLYPHASLADVYYGKVVEALDAGAVADPAFGAMLRDGIANLAAPYGLPFHQLSPETQVNAVTGAQGSAFFEAVRSTTAWTLYPNPQVWSFFGYEGPSADHGGYLEHGFNNIAWLPKE